MTDSTKLETKIKARVDELAEQYRHEGHEVIVEPGPTDLPFKPGGYSPDLLVRKERGGYLIEVRPQAERLSVDRLSSVADEVKKHPGWRFLLVTAQDVVSDELPGEEAPAVTQDDISNRLDRSKKLAVAGDAEAAFLILWIAFEQLLRIRAREAAIPVERLSPAIMIRQLYSLGEISIPQFDVALECERTRNHLVHGFPTADLASSLHKLSTLVGELSADWPVSNTST